MSGHLSISASLRVAGEARADPIETQISNRECGTGTCKCSQVAVICEYSVC